MKSLILGLALGAIIAAPTALYIAKSQSSAHGALSDLASGSSGFKSSSKSKKMSKGAVSLSSVSGRLPKLGESSLSTRNSLALSMDIMNLSQADTLKLLEQLKDQNTALYDQSSRNSLSACFARLAEFGPEQALEKAETLSSSQRWVAQHAVYQEWARTDPFAAVDSALSIENNQQKNGALQITLALLAKEDPEQAFKISQENKNTRAEYSILQVWAATDPVAALEACDTLGQQGQWARGSIIQVWAQKNEAEALDYIKSIESPEAKSSAYSGIVLKYLHEDASKAFAFLTTHSDELKNDSLSSVVYQLAAEDPERTLTWLNGRPKSSDSRNLYAGVISQWVRTEPDKALAYYSSLEDPNLKSKIGDNILSSLASTDPKKYLEYYEQVESSSNNQDWQVQRALSKIAETDLAAAKSYINKIDNATTKTSAIKGIIKILAKKDIEQALSFADEIQDNTQRQAAIGQAFQTLAAKQPEAVAEQFLAQNNSKIGNYSITSFISTYAGENLEGAKEFYNEIQDPLIKDKAIRTLISKWSDTDPLSALEFAAEQPATEGVQNAMWSLGRNLAKTSPEKGLEYAVSLESNSINHKLVEAIFDEWVENDLDAAIDGLSLIENYSGRRDNIYSDIGTQYAKSPDNGTQWLSSLPESSQKNSALSSFVRNWAGNDPNTAAEWVGEMPDGGERDTAVRSLVYTFDNAEPDYALEWASSISNDKQRDNTMKSTFDNWKSRDSKAALNWLNSTDFVTDTQRESWGK